MKNVLGISALFWPCPSSFWNTSVSMTKCKTGKWNGNSGQPECVGCIEIMALWVIYHILYSNIVVNGTIPILNCLKWPCLKKFLLYVIFFLI